MGTATGGIAPLKPSHAKLPPELGKLRLPDGRELDVVSRSDLARALIKMGVPGVSHANGRETNARLYGDYLDKIGEAGRRQAIDERLRRG